ncbi:MAG: hypothetical protein AB1757_12605 [Acidobacteriota bacterium]
MATGKKAGSKKAAAASSTGVTRKVNGGKEKIAVTVDVSNGESLTYEVSLLQGSQANFTLVDSSLNKLLLSHKDATVAANQWSRDWPKPSDSLAVMSVHTLGMHFILAQKYNYKIIHHELDGTDVVLKDIDFSSTNPNDVFFEPLTVVVT